MRINNFVYLGAPLYQPTWYDKIVGTDFGVDRCLRNSQEAYTCFSQYMIRVRNEMGWSVSAVDYINKKAFAYRNIGDGNAAEFWRKIQKNLLKWIQQSGYHYTDFNQWEPVLRILDQMSANSFDYETMMDDRDKFFTKVGAETTKDIWGYWQKVPKEARWVVYGVGGLYAASVLYPIINMIVKLIPDKK